MQQQLHRRAAMKCLVVVLAGAVAMANSLAAGALVADRLTLDLILGASAVTENFEGIALPPSGQLDLGPVLNSSTVHLGHGPGLVIPGVTFRTPTDTQIYSPAFSGGDSQRLGYSSGSPFRFQFSPPARAVGIDLFVLRENGGNPPVEVYDVNGVKLLQSHVGMVTSQTQPTFFGFESTAGIGEVLIGTFIGGPSFDNVTFGAAPEPSAILLGVGFAAAGFWLAWRKRDRANG
jgi:hypothetical protein